jgi:hypothetical protein
MAICILNDNMCFKIYFIAKSDSSNLYMTHGKMYIKTVGMNLILSTFLPNSKVCFEINLKVKHC